MGEYGGFLAILECSNCAYGKHLKRAKAHEYWGLEAHSQTQKFQQKLFEN